MKKTVSLFSIIAVAGLCLMFTSCTRDEDIARSIVLSGQWKGNFGMYYETEDPYGNIVRFNSYDTKIYFIPDYDYATHGEGYQVDWYAQGPYEKLSFHFYWNIENGIIHLDYPGYRDFYNADIYNYNLNNDEFTGYFQIGGERFRLFKLEDYYWDPYYAYEYYPWGRVSFSWDVYYDSYYAKTRSAEATDSVGKPAEGRITKIGSRLSEK